MTDLYFNQSGFKMLCKRHWVLLWYMVGMMPFLESWLYSFASISLYAQRPLWFYSSIETLILTGSEVLCVILFVVSTNFLYLRYTPIFKYVTSKKIKLLSNLEHKLCKNCWTIYITFVNIHNNKILFFISFFSFIIVRSYM